MNKQLLKNEFKETVRITWLKWEKGLGGMDDRSQNKARVKLGQECTVSFTKCDFSKNTFFSGFSNYEFLNVLIFAHLLACVAALAI